MGDSTSEVMKVSGDNSMQVNSDVFLLTFYDSTEPFDYGAAQETVLQYIMNAKGGRGGCFKVVLKNGRRKPFLGKTFEKNENIIGYAFVPEEVAPSSQPGKSLDPIYCFHYLYQHSNHKKVNITNVSLI